MRISDWSSDVCSSDLHIFAALLKTVHPAAGVLDDIGEFLDRVRFARSLFVEDLAAHPVLQLLAILIDVQLPIIGIGITVEVAADHRLRLVPFGDAGRLEAVLHSRPDVEADEIDEIGAEQQRSEEHTSELPSLMRNPYSVI